MTVDATIRPQEAPPTTGVPPSRAGRPDRQLRRRRRTVGALAVGGLAMVTGGIAAGSGPAEWGGALCAALLALYALQLSRLRRRSLEQDRFGEATPGWSEDELAAWLARAAGEVTVDPAGSLDALRAAAPAVSARSRARLLDRWTVTQVLWAGAVGSVYNGLLGLADRLAAGSSMGWLRRRLLTMTTALIAYLGRRSARTVVISALATASTTGFLAASPATAGAATAPVAGSVPVHAVLAADVDTPAPAVAAASSSSYTIQPGDTLWALAARFGTTVEALASANGIANPSVIYPGQVITVAPGPSGTGSVSAGVAVTTAASAAPAGAPASSSSYTIQPGDTLWALAARFGTTVEALASANGIANPSVIYAGQVITVAPGSGPIAAISSTAPPSASASASASAETAPSPPAATTASPTAPTTPSPPAATTASPTAPTSTLAGYANPLRAISNLVPERIDQGVDYAGSGPIYAIGDGVVLNTTNSGWPGGAFISYQLSNGPAAGNIVYVAENVVPRVQVGQQVTPTTVIGTLVDASPNLETGWAQPPGNGNAAATGQWNTTTSTAYGENFSQLLQALGAPPGVSEGTVQGALPAGWPTW